MKYLLDTDILSNLIKRRPSTSLIARMATVPPVDQATSSITFGELLFGAYRLGAEGETLLARMSRVLSANLPVLPFDRTAAWEYARVRAHLERQGTTSGEADLRIAAIALARDLVVVTGNVRHFERVPDLKIENWLQ